MPSSEPLAICGKLKLRCAFEETHLNLYFKEVGHAGCVQNRETAVRVSVISS